MAHRIREAMRDTDPSPLGGAGKAVEVDEMYHGKRETPAVRRKSMPPPTKGGRGGVGQKRPILGPVERGGAARAYHMPQVTARNVRDMLVAKASRKSRPHTDESNLYPRVGAEFAKHETMNHSANEYARGDVTTNAIAGFFGIFELGLAGVYQHCGEQHLQRYLDEFRFRYSNRAKLGIGDAERAVIAIRGAEGKRLTYGGSAAP